jgi:hypothetical protein
MGLVRDGHGMVKSVGYTHGSFRYTLNSGAWRGLRPRERNDMAKSGTRPQCGGSTVQFTGLGKNKFEQCIGKPGQPACGWEAKG